MGELYNRVAMTLRLAGYEVVADTLVLGHLCPLVVPQHRVVVEIDVDRPGEADRLRRNGLQLHGWRVIAVTPLCVRHHLDAIVEAVQVIAGDRKLENSVHARPVEEWHVAFR